MDFFHVYNRGVDKRKTFIHASDYVRFTQNLMIYNSVDAAPHNDWSTTARLQMKPSQRLVTIHAYCLMPNHYHLLLSPLVDQGIPLFMKKVNMGYAKYFNERYERSGALWQGKYKSVHISNDAQFLYIPYYIHLNALDRSLPKWRKGLVKSSDAALATLQNYRWSSHLIFTRTLPIETSPIVGSFFYEDWSPSFYLSQIPKIIGSESLGSASSAIEWD